MFRVDCGKCGGKGNLKMYNHIAGGTCFACKGKGYIEYKTDPAIKKAKNEAKKAEKEAEQKEKIKIYNNKVKKFIDDYKNDTYFIQRMGDMNPYERGFELAQDLMRWYESKKLWQYET